MKKAYLTEFLLEEAMCAAELASGLEVNRSGLAPCNPNELALADSRADGSEYGKNLACRWTFVSGDERMLVVVRYEMADGWIARVYAGVGNDIRFVLK